MSLMERMTSPLHLGGWWWWDAGGIVYVNLPLAASVGCTLLYSFHVNDPWKTPGKNSSPPRAGIHGVPGASGGPDTRV